MSEWMETFISQCLTDVPPGKYRARTEKELRDHMQTQLQFLSKAEALQVMGDPERLREEYHTAWARTLQGRWALRPRLGVSIFSCCLFTAYLYVITFMALRGMGFDRYDSILYYGGPLCQLVYCFVLYLVPTVLGALFLRYCFQETRRPAAWITMGLLIAWTGEKMFLLLEAAWRHIAHRHQGPLTLMVLVRGARWCPGNYAYLWQGIVYVLASFAGCLILGALFGRITERSRELA